jgi:hypothetical protein
MQTVEQIKADTSIMQEHNRTGKPVKNICGEYERVVLDRLLADVFIIQDGKILDFRIYEYSLLSMNNKNVRYWAECISDADEDCLDFWQDDIGICVFLTREAAEKQKEGEVN